MSRNLISGGYPDLRWNIKDAAMLLFTNKYTRYWDQINDYYISYQSKNEKLKYF